MLIYLLRFYLDFSDGVKSQGVAGQPDLPWVSQFQLQSQGLSYRQQFQPYDFKL